MRAQAQEAELITAALADAIAFRTPEGECGFCVGLGKLCIDHRENEALVHRYQALLAKKLSEEQS